MSKLYVCVLAAWALGAPLEPALAANHAADARAAQRLYVRPQIGTASWYGQEHAGKPTASGVAFDPGLLTAAHRTLPLGTRVRVTQLASGRSVIVTINDRGPYVRGRIIDLSQQAADRLGMAVKGLAKVRLDVTEDCERFVETAAAPPDRD